MSARARPGLSLGIAYAGPKVTGCELQLFEPLYATLVDVVKTLAAREFAFGIDAKHASTIEPGTGRRSMSGLIFAQ